MAENRLSSNVCYVCYLLHTLPSWLSSIATTALFLRKYCANFKRLRHPDPDCFCKMSPPSYPPEDGIPMNTTAVAIDKDKNSHYAVRWAIDHLVISNPLIILIHVRHKANQHRRYPLSFFVCLFVILICLVSLFLKFLIGFVLVLRGRERC